MLGRFEEYLRSLQDDPTQPLDVKLLEEFEIYLSTSEAQRQGINKWLALFYQIAPILPTLQQDPTPLNHVALKLAGPLPFEQVNRVNFVPGLHPSAHCFHELTLSLLEKAAETSSDAEVLANQTEVMFSLVKLWLSVEDTGIASKASELLVSLLKKSQNSPDTLDIDGASSYGHGAVWKRLFGDKDIYRLFFSMCTLKRDPKAQEELSKKQKTIAQARLLDWLPRVGALDWESITQSHPSTSVDLEWTGLGNGLLDFAAIDMVDYQNDVLMHISLINFYSDLIRHVRRSEFQSYSRSVSLQYLIGHGLHQRALSYWLDPSSFPSFEILYLSAPSANYIATHASNYSKDFAESTDLTKILERLHTSFDLTSSQWAHGSSPKHELHILASLPRHILLSTGSGLQGWTGSPLSRVPFHVTNADALNTLATIFRGPDTSPPSQTIQHPPRPQSRSEPPTVESTDLLWTQEQKAACALFWLYFSQCPTLFTELVAHADTVVIKDKALAAINLICAITTADWSSAVRTSLAPQNDAVLERVEALIGSLRLEPNTLYQTGVDLVVSNDPVNRIVMPYFIRPAASFSNLVGGHGNTDSAAYEVAAAKYDMLSQFYQRLKEMAPKEGSGESYYEVVRELIKKRINEGLFGAGSEIGGRIGTLEL